MEAKYFSFRCFFFSGDNVGSDVTIWSNDGTGGLVADDEVVVAADDDVWLNDGIGTLVVDDAVCSDEGVVADDEVCLDDKATDFFSDDAFLSDDADWWPKRLFSSDDKAGDFDRSMIECSESYIIWWFDCDEWFVFCDDSDGAYEDPEELFSDGAFEDLGELFLFL